MTLAIRKTCYFPKKRPRVWWWKVVDAAGEIVADGFSSKREAAVWMERRTHG